MLILSDKFFKFFFNHNFFGFLLKCIIFFSSGGFVEKLIFFLKPQFFQLMIFLIFIGNFDDDIIEKLDGVKVL